jgi:hypothetical protein
MSATEEQLQLISDANITHISYILVLYSFAFLLFLFTNMLIHLYAVNAVPTPPPKDIEQRPILNGHIDSRRVHDAEEFELDGLMSDEEEHEGMESPSTLDKINEERVSG